MAVVIIAGCTGGDDQAASPTPSPEPSAATPRTPASEPSPEVNDLTEEPPATDERPSPTTRDDAAEAAVLTAYLGYWDAIREANDPPDEFHPALERYATGEAFESVFEAAQTNRLAGRALRLPEDSISEHRAEVASVDGDTATVRDCSVNNGLVVDIETGEVVNDAVVTRLVTGTLHRVDETWKVATTRVEQLWEGVAGCAEEA